MGSEMNKSELIDHVASSAGITKAAANLAFEAFVTGITNSLRMGEPVVMVGFGTFSVSERAARTGRNPKTGAPLEIPASRVPKFQAGKSLKDAVK
ncbi:MAG: HU family DNA-binding protein [Rhodocyclaceae bacterium]|nr:HU family DNA-binding protein [Rhodocyclaceae bacterium]